jgi:hypothetical protein
MKILLDFSAKVGMEDIFKPTLGNQSLHEISNDKGVINYSISKNLIVKSTLFPHSNIHKFTWTSTGGKTQNQNDHTLIDRRQHSNALSVRRFRASDSDTDQNLVVAEVTEILAGSKQTTH